MFKPGPCLNQQVAELEQYGVAPGWAARARLQSTAPPGQPARIAVQFLQVRFGAHLGQKIGHHTGLHPNGNGKKRVLNF